MLQIYYVTNILCYKYIAFWQHKIDIKDFLSAEMSQIEGEAV